MRHKFLFAFLLILTSAYSAIHAENSWYVTKDNSPFSYTAVFEIKKGETSAGKVVRTGLFTPSYYYDLYDANDSLLVRGITRVFSLGMLFAWGTDIDLYDGNQLVGMIQGKIWTRSRAKFSFYDAYGQLTASAYLNDESCNFLIVSEQNPGEVLAELDGKSFGDASIWKMKPINNPLSIDEGALQIFAGFVADFQKNFIRPPKKEIYFYYDRGN
jgi:hypothetical protein